MYRPRRHAPSLHVMQATHGAENNSLAWITFVSPFLEPKISQVYHSPQVSLVRQVRIGRTASWYCCFGRGELDQLLVQSIRLLREVVTDLEVWKPSLRRRLFNIKQEVEHDQVARGAGGKKAEAELSTTDAVTTKLDSSKRFKRVCVFCGSSSGNKDIFGTVALSLGRQLVSRKVDLVYGGGSIGLMGQVAQTVHAGGGHVIGVIPKALMGKEICGQTVGELITVLDMHQRKAEMARLADAFVALPGGYGTLEELLEVITWSQLGIHEKLVGLLNVDGYYNSLLALFDKALEEGFLGFPARNIVVSAPTACELLDKMEAYTPIHDWTIPKLCWGDAKSLVYTPAVPSATQLNKDRVNCL